MLQFLKAILFSVGVTIVLSAFFVLRRALQGGKVDAFDAGMVFVCAVAAFWILAFKDWVQARNTKIQRELDDLSSIEDELVKLVRRNDAFSFTRRSVIAANAGLDYAWVIQSTSFDFNFAIAKVKLRQGHPIDANSLRKKIKTDLKPACGGWFLRPLILGVVLETSDSNDWHTDSFIDHNYASGIGIAWLIVLDKGTMRLSSARYPKSLRTTTFYDQFVSHLLAKGYAQANSSTEPADRCG